MSALNETQTNNYEVDGDDGVIAQLDEVVSGGDLVSFVAGSSPLRAVRANAATSKPAHGFVLQAGGIGSTAVVYTRGRNNQVTGVSVGELFLSGSNPGKTVSQPPVLADGIIQYVGEGVAATEYLFDPDQPIQV